jgi:Zn-dependent peptidase ImmA (M78 family)
MKGNPTRRNRYIRSMASCASEVDSTHAVEAFVRRFPVNGDSLESLAKKLGVAEIMQARLPCDGAISTDGNARVSIILNSLSPPSRQRFTLAHEIGHLMLWGFVRKDTKCGADRELERTCDAIAAELLLPSERVASYARGLGGPSPYNLKLVAQRFGVSLQAAAVRLHCDLRLWSHSIGLWHLDCERDQTLGTSGRASSGCPRERWFVGRRRWNTKYPPFRVFFEALKSSAAVRGRESYFEGSGMRPIALEVLHLGQGRLLGTVA